MGLLSGLLAAMAYLQVTALGKAGEPEARIVFYFSVGSICVGALETSLLLHVAPELITDAETVARLGASPEKGRRAYDYILDQVEVRWLRQPLS